MKTDNYTRFILTVIALCLTINVLTHFEMIPKAHASDQGSTHQTQYALVPVSEASTVDVRIVDINTYDELNVNLKGVDTYEEVRVNIKSIETDDELDVNLDEVGGGWVPHGGPLNVKLD
jgi:hypothetical protein